LTDALQTLLQTALLQRPRPWRIVGDAVIEDTNGQEVCTIDTQRNLADDVAAALAQLIAGAPMVEPGAILRHRDGRTGAFVSVEDDGRYRVQSLKGNGFWVFHPDDCVVAPAEGAGVKWHRLGDVLPEYGRPLLIASKREGEDFWRVRDAHLYRRYEGVYASLDHLKGGEFAKDWWFNSIYPGTSDLRLAHEDLLWTYMPTPDDAMAEARA